MGHAVKVPSIFNDVIAVHDFKIFPANPFPKMCNFLKKSRKTEKIKMFNQIFEQAEHLNCFLLLLHSNLNFSLVKGVTKLLVFSVNFPLYNIVEEDISKIDNFQDIYADIWLNNFETIRAKICPTINNPGISMIFHCLSCTIDPSVFDRLLMDTLRNCIALPELVFKRSPEIQYKSLV